MSKQVMHSSNARQHMLEGVSKLASVVRVLLLCITCFDIDQTYVLVRENDVLAIVD